MSELSTYIWYEKHRAKKLDDLVLSKNIRNNIKGYIKNKEIPHLLFHGPAGSGKTTLALILINSCASSSLVLNASSEDRGIATIKKKVKQFASSKRLDSKKLNIILLDEADGLTSDAQDALKNTIEKYQSNCRFIFTANEIDKITDPIYSRCTLFSFQSMPHDYFLEFLYDILEEEKIKYKQEDIELVVERFGPDVRTILNNIQAGSVSGKFKIKNILDLFNTSEVKKLINKGKILEIRQMWRGHNDFTWFYRYMFEEYLSDKKIEKENRIDIALILAEFLWKNNTVADREINATACCLEIMSILEKDVMF